MRRKEPLIRMGTPLHHAIEYAMLLVGSLIIALSFNLFLNPNQVASGGASGISTILEHTIGLEPAVGQWLLNIPLFVAGVLLLGKSYGLKTAVGSVVLPLFVLFTQHLPSPTDNVLLAAIYGGIGVGLGIGIVFRGRGSTGGLSVAAQLVHKYTGLSLALSIALMDGLVILSAGFVFSAEKALYALIGLYVTTKTIDIVQMGFGYSKVAFIISHKTDELSEAILHVLDRGLTKLNGAGGYTGDERVVLMVVVGQTEISKLKTIVQTVDPTAFVIISDTTEVLGEGFKLQA